MVWPHVAPALTTADDGAKPRLFRRGTMAKFLIDADQPVALAQALGPPVIWLRTGNT